MKKSLLSTGLISSILLASACMVTAQNGRVKGITPQPILKDLPNEVVAPLSQSALTPIRKYGNNKKNPSTLASTYRLIGYACYDLQSNNSVGRTIINHGDGTLSFAWTTDDECTSSFARRGSAYNYWNGASLLYPLGADTSIETVRTGFAQIGYLGNGGEVIMAHKGAPYGFKILKNGTKGSGTWTVADAHASDTVGGEMSLWGRIATGGSDGNSIHLISNYFTTPVINGLLTPMVYSRSQDAGVTWDKKSVMLPGYDTVRYLGGNAENYCIDANGTTVAIVHGGIDEDIALWKSTDNGSTFTKSYVDSFAYAPSIDTTGTTGDMDTTSDGTTTVVIGPTGVVHVAYATVRVEVGGFYPGDAELVYWNSRAAGSFSKILLTEKRLVL